MTLKWKISTTRLLVRQVRSICKYTTVVVTIGIVLFQFMSLSCNPKQDASNVALDILLNNGFSIYTSVDSIPRSLVYTLPFTDTEAEPVMADPDAVFNMTDVVLDEDLPFKRLIFAGQSDGYWFIYYEQGGWGYGCHLILYEYIDNRFEPMMQLNIDCKLPDLEEVRRLIINSKEMSID